MLEYVNNINQRQPISIVENEETRQLKFILSRLIWASWAILSIIIFITLYWGNSKTFTAALVGGILQFVPFWLLRRGQLKESSLIVMLSSLGIVTMLATVGQGIRDIALIVYPIVFIFAGLILNQTFYRLCVGVSIAAVCWLVLGENMGWFVTQPFYEDRSNLLYLLIVIVLLLLAAYAVELLATNLRKNLEKAQSEISQRKDMEEQLRFQSTHDALTGIYNRAFFETELARLEKCRDYPISIIVADVDKLKVVNDTMGHAAGDDLLKQIADHLYSEFRESDILARIGGDEFAVLLPGTDKESVKKVLLRTRQRLMKHNAEHPEFPIQLSLGAATAEKDNLTEIFKKADRQMYADKATHNK